MNRLAIVAFLLAAPAIAQQPLELQPVGESITLTIGDDGIAMIDFVKLAQELTGREFTFEARELAAAEPVKQIGTMKFKKADFVQDFLKYFQTRLYLEGFALQANDDTGVTAIVALPKRSDAARFVPVGDLDDHKTDIAKILTSIELAHLAPQTALERVRTALASSANRASLARVGGALLVQGSGAEVYCIWRMVSLIDVRPAAIMESVALQHAAAADLAACVKVLLADSHPTVIVIPHMEANALMLSGPPAVVEHVIEIVGLLDDAAKK